MRTGTRYINTTIAVALMLTCWVARGQAQQEVLEQWAFAVVGVSSAGDGDIHFPNHITGPPDSDACDPSAQRSWQTQSPDSGMEWVEMRFTAPVYPFAIEIYQSLNPGAVTVVSARDEDGKLHRVWEGVDTTHDCPGILRIEFPSQPFATRAIRVELNTELVPGFNRIDALKLIGYSAEDEVVTFFETVSEDDISSPPLWLPLALVDFDHDGWLDVFGHVLGDSLAYALGNAPKFIFLHNEGNGKLSDRSSLLADWPINTSLGGRFADYDRDGDLDFFIPGGSVVINQSKWPDALLRNDGGRFTDVTAEAGFHDILLSAAALWWDYDRDGWPDLYISRGESNWVNQDPNTLFRNMGDGTFVETTTEAGLDVDFYPSRSDDYRGGGFDGFSSGDFNNDGWPDLYVPVRLSSNRLLLNDGTGRFRDATTSEVDDIGEVAGVAVGDIDNDGDLDIFQPATWGETVSQRWRSLMLLNLGEANFLDVTEGVGLARTNNSAYPHLVDFDNDGDLDLLIDTPSMLFLNDGQGNFSERTFQSGLIGAASFGDLSGDGFLDVWTILSFHRNKGNENHYLRIKPVGTRSSREGIGTRVYATAGELRQMRELSTGSEVAQSDMVFHLGLGQHTQVDQLEIRWPSGQVDIIKDIPADQEIRIIEGRNEWYPTTRSTWTIEPPATLTYGHEINFIAEAKPSLFEPTATITSVVADLSSLGGPQALPLEDLGDGTYRLEHTFTVGGESELRDVEVFVLQETSLGEYWINLSRNIDVEGDPNTAVLEDYSDALPESSTLTQNYPNPFNSGTVIRFGLSEEGEVTLAIYNLAGQKVATLMQGRRQAGEYAINWDGENDAGKALATGIYLYRLKSGERVETKKLTLLR